MELVLQGVLNNEIGQVEFREPFSALSILVFSRAHVERLIDQGRRDTGRLLTRDSAARD